jgi:hypothetical protein
MIPTLLLGACTIPMLLASATSEYPCPSVATPSTLTATQFRTEYWGKLPVVFPASLTPSDEDDAYTWSKRILLLRHGESKVKLGTNTSLALTGAADDEDGGGGGSSSTANFPTLQEYLDGAGEPGYLFLTGIAGLNAKNKKSGGKPRLGQCQLCRQPLGTPSCRGMLEGTCMHAAVAVHECLPPNHLFG